VIGRILRALGIGRTLDAEPEPDVIPDLESPVRRMLADVHGGSYVAYASREEAAADPDAAMVIEGDYGNQIFVACPLRAVTASDEDLEAPLHELDRIAWGRDYAEACDIRFERAPVGSGVAGGMGGGRVDEAIWVHEEFVKAGLDERIREVIRGERRRLKEAQ
jgi:hypothetical protein